MPLRPPAGFIRPGYDPLKVPDAPTIGKLQAAVAEHVFTAQAAEAALEATRMSH